MVGMVTTHCLQQWAMDGESHINICQIMDFKKSESLPEVSSESSGVQENKCCRISKVAWVGSIDFLYSIKHW